MLRGAPKELRKIIREAEELGWTFQRTKASHIKAKHADGVRMVFISGTPSDYRALMNIKKDLGL